VNGISGEKYIRRFGFPEEKIVHIPCTTDLTPFLNIHINRNKTSARRLLYSGQLIQRKGLFEFHSAFCRWAQNHPEKTWEWWCIGDGPLREELLQLPTPPNALIKFCGNINFKDLAEYYQQAGIFIFPTLADEWGVVINEAMGSGLPVIGSIYSQAVEELIEEGVTGWVFHPDVPAEIYSALERSFSTSTSVMSHMRESARKRIAIMTPEKIAEKMTRHLFEML
jgi:glycosyltransferase involved in cell wall biosynthesis